MLAYLERYAAENDLERFIAFGAWVDSVRPEEGRWEVTVRDNEPRRFDAVVVATGHYWNAHIPELPGRFDGVLIHARDYRTPDRFSGQRVVVAGGAQSALDIVAEIATTASRTILACTEVHHLLPRRVLGRPFDAFDTDKALLVPLPVARALSRTMMRLSRATPDRGDLPRPRHRMFETRWPTVVSPQAQEAISRRAFEIRPRLRELAGDHIVFADGSEEEVDAVIFATGYRINFPFLPDHLGRGRGWEFPLYRRILSPGAPGLAFVGVLEPGPGLFEIVERQSEWLAEALAGTIPIPGREGMWRAIDSGGERRSRRQFAATGSRTILCNRHAYLRLLARDLGAKRRRTGV
jgi:cation diffusion facilitator CzcD-associated flavoprotein CzcO